MFSKDEMRRAIEDALKSMEGIALELYRRGREEAREELETVKRERDEARAEVERLRAAVHTRACRNQSAYNLNCVCGADERQRDLQKLAYRRGAEAMREACASAMHPIMRSMISRTEAAQTIRALPIPEEP